MPARLKTAVVGASGYSGFELARLLMRHPRLAPPALFHRERSPVTDLAQAFPVAGGNDACRLEPFSWEGVSRQGVELLFLATPHQISRAWAPTAIDRGLRVVDLSGAWRLKSDSHQDVYEFEDPDPQRAAQLLKAGIYGLPELNRAQIPDSALVANPGCYATSIIVALAPLLAARLVDLECGIVCDSKSGVSGAGKQPTAQTHFVEVANNLSAYAALEHRHVPEILEQLQLSDEQFMFTAHLLPIPRGIMSTVYLKLLESATAQEITERFAEFYAGSPWVRIFGTTLPQIRYSLHTNFCDVGFKLDKTGRRMVLVSCLDNLLKGAAGQAVQNMNVMFGWSEREGLA